MKLSGDTGRVVKVIVLWVALAAGLCASACGGLYALAAYRLSDL